MIAGVIAVLPLHNLLGSLELALSDGRRIKLSEVATISDTVADPRSAALLDGKPVVGFEVARSRGESEVTVGAAVQQALAYPEYSAGRLMQREVVVAPEGWTVGEAIDHLRSTEHLPDQFYHVILVDTLMRPQAYVTLGRLLSSRRDVRLVDILEDSYRTVQATDPEADVAYIFNQYHLISCPVVDAGGGWWV